VPSRAFLHFYASKLTAVEVNYTFRSDLTEDVLRSWLDATPPGFRFCFKAPQAITHFQRLRDCHAAVATFVDSVRLAGRAGKLGPLLFQLPPNFAPNPTLLAEFLKAPAFRRRSAPPIAFEFRHAGWFAEATYTVLRRHGAGLCLAESDDLVTPEIFTAPFRYYRLRRSGGYPLKTIKAFAERFTEMSRNAEVFAFLKHEDEPTGALLARKLVQHSAKVDMSAAKAATPEAGNTEAGQ
jgi:uncharacterized protein YecE (DUF72 family)